MIFRKERTMKIVDKKTSELIPYEANPRENGGAVEYVASSIKEFGFKVPIIVDANNVVVAGHTRLKAAQELGMDKVPCIVADDLTEEQVKAFRIADNKVGEASYWDTELLGTELEGLISDFDFTDFGFGEFELRLLTEDMTPEPYDKEIELEYAGHEEQFLAGKRVIITYTDEHEADVKALLGVDEIKKVSYSIEEVLNARN